MSLNQRVPGSSPGAPTKPCKNLGISQERHSDKASAASVLVGLHPNDMPRADEPVVLFERGHGRGDAGIVDDAMDGTEPSLACFSASSMFAACVTSICTLCARRQRDLGAIVEHGN